jgi:exodeoxyribonuclease V beta subunit
MDEIIYRELNSLTCPLTGSNVIEASAGTGKTYNIQNLFARLILEKGYPIDSILVVTFTDAATKELKDRIRKMLQNIQLYYNGVEIPKEELDRVMSMAPINTQDNKYKQRLSTALSNFDSASIFTIHGFCNKILKDFAFESGILFDIALETDPGEIIDDIIEDFYRRAYYKNNLFIEGILSTCRLKPEDLKHFIRDVSNNPCVKIVCDNESNYQLLEKCYYNILEILPACPEEIYLFYQNAISNKLLHGNKFRTKTFELKWESFIKNISNLQQCNFKELCSSLDYFTREKLEKSFSAKVVKNPALITVSENVNSFIDYISQILKLINGIKNSLRLECREYFIREYTKRKLAENIQTFDDLLNTVNRLVHNSKSPLLKKVREIFNAALIDEFQDTDAIQYSIFKKIFIEADKVVFMVGDPKQAIYGFRGGDIFTYQKARDEQKNGKTYTLQKNWRSSPQIIQAVNTLFEKDDNNPLPFMTKAIDFSSSDSSSSNNGKFNVNHGSDKKPVKLIMLNSEGESFKSDEFKKACCERVAAEISGILSDKTITIEEHKYNRHILPKDIAVLVTKHSHAKMLQPLLQNLNIPAVLQSSGSIFDSREAKHLSFLLKAIGEPGNVNHVKGALVTDFISLDAEDLGSFTDDNVNDGSCNRFVEILVAFKELHSLWVRGSFIEMFNMFLINFNVREKLLGQSGGERKLTNVLHLAEILHQEELDRKLGINTLSCWLDRQLNAETRAGKDKKEHEIRLETDSEAVTVMTVHKSKGLEFPIVFCPFIWDKNAKSCLGEVAKYHKNPDEYVLDISGSDTAGEMQNDEDLEELMRLLYVAVTRAKYQCYILWGNIATKNSSALDYLFFGKKDIALLPKGEKAKSLDKKVKEVKKLERINFRPNLSPSQEEFIKLDCSTMAFNKNFRYHHTGTDKKPHLIARQFPKNGIDLNWQISSFSNIAPYTLNLDILKDNDETDNKYEARDNVISLNSDVNIFNFPAGAKTGSCWHDIFNDLDFTSDDEEISRVVNNKLALYALDTDTRDQIAEQKRQCVADMVDNVLNRVLCEDTGLRLRDIPNENKLVEMEFNYSLKEGGFTSYKLKKCLETYVKEFGVKYGILNWNMSVSGGFMNGFLDLVLRYNGKYYILDWKSNKLDGIPTNFDSNALTGEMARHCYFLQYLIYTVALDKYLTLTCKDYSYNKDFGGVYYIFLRGIDHDRRSSRGIFYTLPEYSLVKKLSDIFTPVNKG